MGRKKKKEEPKVVRVKIPKEPETFGIIEQRLGGNKMSVRCADGQVRICRVPGKYARRLWLREGDLVVVKPWEVQSDERGDIIYSYTRAQKSWLIKEDILPEEFR